MKPITSNITTRPGGYLKLLIELRRLKCLGKKFAPISALKILIMLYQRKQILFYLRIWIDNDLP